MRVMLVVPLLVAGSIGLGGAHAQTQTVPAAVQYQVGWNMLGVPPGTGLAAAQALYVYGPSGYTSASSPAGAGCTGYWAYFSKPAAEITLANSASTAQTCQLQAGWNLLGNPFPTAASLPAGIIGYYWDASGRLYAAVHFIPAGAAVWIDAANPASLTLRAVPPAAPALTITTPTGQSTPYQVHVGQVIQLQLNAFGPSFYLATADPRFLTLERYQARGAEPEVQTWLWRASVAGNATITVTPPCALTTPHCDLAFPQIKIEVLP